MNKPQQCLFDTNLFIDLFEKREPFVQQAIVLFSMIEREQIRGVVCANSITTIFYLLKNKFDKLRAIQAIDMILAKFEVAPVDKTILLNAQSMNARDFEDAVIMASAQSYGVDMIITRNVKDFKISQLPVYTSVEAVALLSS